MMKKPFEIQLKKYELWGGLVWCLVYLTVISLIIEGVLQLLGIEDYSETLLNGIYFFGAFFMTALVFHRFLADSLPGVWQQFGRFMKSLIFGFCLYEVFEIVMGIGLNALYPDFMTPNDDTITTLAGMNYSVMWVGAVLLAPLTEETLMRGLIFGSLRRSNRILAYGVSALLFAAMHIIMYVSGMDAGSIVVNLIIYSLPAVALCACYEYSGTIWSAIALHMIINAMGMSALG